MTIYLLFCRMMVPVFLFIFTVLPASAAVNAQKSAGQGNDANGEAGGAGGRFLTAVSDRMQDITEWFSEAGQGLLGVPEIFRGLLVKVRDPEVLVVWGEMAGKVFLAIAAGIFAGWLAGRMLDRLRRRTADRDIDTLLLRGMFMIMRAVLDIIPVVVFAGAAYAILPLMDPRQETRLIALSLVNAAVLAQVILAFSRLVLVPDVPALRLLRMGEESIHYFYIWIRRLVMSGVYGYFILEAVLLMGMPEGVYRFLMKFLGLAVTAMMVILVMQNKKDIAGWLLRDRAVSREAVDAGEDRFDAEKPGLLVAKRNVGVFRRRFADLWHIPAIIMIVGTFSIWVFEVEGGMMFLLSGLAMTLVVVLLAGLLLHLVHHGVDRLFTIREELKRDYPDLETRANRYKPFLRNTLKGVVYAVAFFSILEAWGMGTLAWLFSPTGGLIIGELAMIFFIIAGAFLLWEIVSAMIERSLAREAVEGGSTRKLTLLPLLKNVVRITLALIASMLLLSQIGINIGPLLAGAGVIGLAIGFGAQTLVRDVITGAFILLENAISVGDWVEAGGHSGTVERLTVRTVTLRDLAGTVHVVPFGEVTTVTNYNRDFGYALIDAGVAYRERYGDVVQALQDVAVSLRRDDFWGQDIAGDLEVFGMNNLGDSAVEIRVRIKTRPMRQFAVRRVFLENMKRVFDERGIEIPFPHRTIWFGADKDGTAPPMYLMQKGLSGKTAPLDVPAEEPKVRIASESDASEGVVQDKNQRDGEAVFAPGKEEQ